MRPDILAAVLERYVERVDTKSRAARRLGISRMQLDRYLHPASPATMLTGTYDALLANLNSDEKRDLRSAIVSWEAEAFLRSHNAWLAGKLAPFGLSMYAETNGWPDHQPPAEAADGLQAQWAQATWSMLQHLYDWRGPQLVAFERRLCDLGFGNRQTFEKVREADGNRTARAAAKILEGRGLLALVRLIEPFGQAFGQSILETPFSDNRKFRGRVLVQYLAASIQREILLLSQRKPDLDRAQQLADHLKQ